MDVYVWPIITILLAIIGWFIVRAFKTQDSTNIKLCDSIDRLDRTMGRVEGQLSLENEKINNLQNICRLRHGDRIQ
jgi:hypothetical protein